MNCRGHGFCTTGGFRKEQCICFMGYEGMFCERKTASLCIHGVDYGNGVCGCHVGWMGKTCNETWSEVYVNMEHLCKTEFEMNCRIGTYTPGQLVGGIVVDARRYVLMSSNMVGHALTSTGDATLEPLDDSTPDIEDIARSYTFSEDDDIDAVREAVRKWIATKNAKTLLHANEAILDRMTKRVVIGTMLLNYIYEIQKNVKKQEESFKDFKYNGITMTDNTKSLFKEMMRVRSEKLRKLASSAGSLVANILVMINSDPIDVNDVTSEDLEDINDRDFIIRSFLSGLESSEKDSLSMDKFSPDLRRMVEKIRQETHKLELLLISAFNKDVPVESIIKFLMDNGYQCLSSRRRSWRCYDVRDLDRARGSTGSGGGSESVDGTDRNHEEEFWREWKDGELDPDVVLWDPDRDHDGSGRNYDGEGRNDGEGGHSGGNQGDITEPPTSLSVPVIVTKINVTNSSDVEFSDLADWVLEYLMTIFEEEYYVGGIYKLNDMSVYSELYTYGETMKIRMDFTGSTLNIIWPYATDTVNIYAVDPLFGLRIRSMETQILDDVEEENLQWLVYMVVGMPASFCVLMGYVIIACCWVECCRSHARARGEELEGEEVTHENDEDNVASSQEVSLQGGHDTGSIDANLCHARHCVEETSSDVLPTRTRKNVHRRTRSDRVHLDNRFLFGGRIPAYKEPQTRVRKPVSRRSR